MKTTATTSTRTAGMTRKGESRALRYANVAQLVELLPCKQRVVGSNPTVSSKKNMNTLNAIRSITTASAVRAGVVGVCADSSMAERSLDKRVTRVRSSLRTPMEPLRERWRAPTHAHTARTGCIGNSKFLSEEFESLAPCYCTGGSTDLFTAD